MLLKSIAYLYFLLNVTSNIHLVSSKEENESKSKLPPCRACKVFVESFKKGIERTQKGNFQGGDTAWEEENLGSYATSEIRLTEIQEKLCSDVTEGKDQCYALHEEHDADIEEWWFHKQTIHTDMYAYFCIETFRTCCPENHFGPECRPCVGFPDNVCGKNGKCKGAGTRKGNGKCCCDTGYQGATCLECADTHYESYRDEKKLLCSACHVSCDGKCSKAGSAGCSKCKPGWLLANDDKGCLDVNECANPQTPCKPNQFCVNTDGSYKCLDCDKSCNGCTGDGPDMCNSCAEDYILVDSHCISASQESRKKFVSVTRYLTYLGMCIATCIIFQKNTTIAAIVGLAVAVYIVVSENMLNKPATPNTADLAEKLLSAQ